MAEKNIMCRCTNGDFWAENDIPVVFATLTDAVQAGNVFIADTFEAGMAYTEDDIEVVIGDNTLTLAEARQELAAQTLTDVGDVLEAIAVHGEYDKDYLEALAKSCRVVVRNYA